MTASGGEELGAADRLRAARDAVRRAFHEFLAVPTSTITAFLVLAVLVYAADRNTPRWLEPTRRFLEHHAFVDADTTTGVLTAIAAGIITVTSITVSVLLLAVQQSAASMTSAIFDQFLRRRWNQLSFGFFIGLALYTLITLATVHRESNAVFGATLAFVFTVAALYGLLLLLYSTVDQMRPSVVLGSISRLTLAARRGQHTLLARTRRHATPGTSVLGRVTTTTSGYVTRIDLPALEDPLAGAPGGLEVVLVSSIGTYVAYGDVLAELRGASGAPGPVADPGSLTDAVRAAVHVEFDRDISGDPAYGIEQIHTIGWTSISSSKSNPAPGLAAVRTLRDLLARWADATEPTEPTEPAARQAPPDPASPHLAGVLPVVYVDDTVARLFGALESLGTVASESKQHQSLSEVLHALATLVGRLAPDQRRRAGAVVDRLLPSLPSYVRTALLDDALLEVANSLDAAGESESAEAVRAARRPPAGGHRDRWAGTPLGS